VRGVGFGPPKIGDIPQTPYFFQINYLTINEHRMVCGIQLSFFSRRQLRMKQWKGPSRFEVFLNLLFIFQSTFGVIYGVLFGPFLGIEVLWYVGWLVLVVGFLFFYLALREFKEKGGALEGESLQFTTVLVDTGVYAIIRHPQCLGGILLMCASILISQHWLSAIIGVSISAYYYLSVPKDEEHLIEKFGDDYKRYMQRVPKLNPLAGVVKLLRQRTKD